MLTRGGVVRPVKRLNKDGAVAALPSLRTARGANADAIRRSVDGLRTWDTQTTSNVSLTTSLQPGVFNVPRGGRLAPQPPEKVHGHLRLNLGPRAPKTPPIAWEA